MRTTYELAALSAMGTPAKTLGLCFGVVMSLVGLRARPACAQGDAPRVSVQRDACVHVDRKLFEHLLDAELALTVDYSGERTAGDRQTTVWLTCVTRGVRLYLQDNLTGKSMVRVVVPGDITEHSQSRLLALAVAEFVAASWTELRVHRPRAAAGARTLQAMEQRVTRFAEKHHAELVASSRETIAARAPSGAGRPAQRSNAREPELPTAGSKHRDATAARLAWRSGIALEAVKLASISNPWLGVEAAGAVRPWPALQVGVAVQLSRCVFHGSLDGQPMPKITLTSLSAGLQMLFVHTVRGFDLSAGIGMRTGIAWLRVSGTDALTPRGSDGQLTNVPMGLFSAGYAISSDMQLGLKLQLGRVLRGVNVAVVENPQTPDAQQTSVAALRGLWLAATWGLEWVF